MASSFEYSSTGWTRRRKKTADKKRLTWFCVGAKFLLEGGCFLLLDGVMQLEKKGWIRWCFGFMWCRIWDTIKQVSLWDMTQNNFHVGWRCFHDIKLLLPSLSLTFRCCRIVSGSLLRHHQCSRVVPCGSWRLRWRRCHFVHQEFQVPKMEGYGGFPEP